MVFQTIIYLTLRYTLDHKDKVDLPIDDKVTLLTNVWSMGEGSQYTTRQLSVSWSLSGTPTTWVVQGVQYLV